MVIALNTPRLPRVRNVNEPKPRRRRTPKPLIGKGFLLSTGVATCSICGAKTRMRIARGLLRIACSRTVRRDERRHPTADLALTEPALTAATVEALADDTGATVAEATTAFEEFDTHDRRSTARRLLTAVIKLRPGMQVGVIAIERKAS